MLVRQKATMIPFANKPEWKCPVHKWALSPHHLGVSKGRYNLTFKASRLYIPTIMARNGTDTVLLQPRQYARHPGKLLLLPLLPLQTPVKPLPPEIWREIFCFAAASSGSDVTSWSLSYLTICKSLKVINVYHILPKLT
jgi:hypothetical protein